MFSIITVMRSTTKLPGFVTASVISAALSHQIQSGNMSEFKIPYQHHLRSCCPVLQTSPVLLLLHVELFQAEDR